MTTIIIGSREWCLQWAEFYRQQAVKFSRMKYPGDERDMYYALMCREEWLCTEPWA